ncbi:hypothetical protein MBLNU459_g1966t2 [Dothideomycetes sp. NU459]
MKQYLSFFVVGKMDQYYKKLINQRPHALCQCRTFETWEEFHMEMGFDKVPKAIIYAEIKKLFADSVLHLDEEIGMFSETANGYKRAWPMYRMVCWERNSASPNAERIIVYGEWASTGQLAGRSIEMIASSAAAADRPVCKDPYLAYDDVPIYQDACSSCLLRRQIKDRIMPE